MAADITKIGKTGSGASLLIGGKQVGEVDKWNLDFRDLVVQEERDRFWDSMAKSSVPRSPAIPEGVSREELEQFLLSREMSSEIAASLYSAGASVPVHYANPPSYATDCGPVIKTNDGDKSSQVDRAARVSLLPNAIGKTPGQAAQGWQKTWGWGTAVAGQSNSALRDEMAMSAMQALVVAAVKTTSQDAIGEAMEQLVFGGQAQRISDLAYFLADQMLAAKRRADEADAVKDDHGSCQSFPGVGSFANASHALKAFSSAAAAAAVAMSKVEISKEDIEEKLVSDALIGKQTVVGRDGQLGNKIHP